MLQCFVRWTAFLLLPFCFQQAASQTTALTLDQQREEFAIFRGALEEGHNGMYYFISREAFAHQCDSVGQTLTEDATVDAFYLKLRYLAALLRHGHTRVNLPGSQPVNYLMMMLKPDRLYLPLQITIIDSRLYVLQDCSDEQSIRRGAEIVRINGKPVARLLDTMRYYLSADGRNQTFKSYFLYNYYYFHFLYNLMYPSEDAFDLTVTGMKKTIRIKGQTPAAVSKTYEAKTGKPVSYFGEQLTYNSSVAPRTAYLKMGSFFKGFIEFQGQRYEPFLDSVFANIKHRRASKLILDLRNNEGGGDGYNNLLFAYLGGKPAAAKGFNNVASRSFRYAKYMVDVSEEAKAFIADPSAFLIDSSLLLKPEFADNDVPKPTPTSVFNGALYVLTNGGTFSAATTLVSDLYEHRRATGRKVLFIGEENGGDVYAKAMCAGQSYKIALPYSGIQVDMPFLCSGELNTVHPAKRLPDYPVVNTINDLLAGRDAVLRFAIEKAKK